MRFGNITIETHVGTTLTHHVEGCTMYFQPGDDAGDLHDALEATEAALDDRNVSYSYADVLEAVWDDYRDAGREIEE
jgi:hypothetical protein